MSFPLSFPLLPRNKLETRSDPQDFPFRFFHGINLKLGLTPRMKLGLTPRMTPRMAD